MCTSPVLIVEHFCWSTFQFLGYNIPDVLISDPKESCDDFSSVSLSMEVSDRCRLRPEVRFDPFHRRKATSLGRWYTFFEHLLEEVCTSIV